MNLEQIPKVMQKKINEYVSYFKGKTLRIPGSNAGIRTEEGAAHSDGGFRVGTS